MAKKHYENFTTPPIPVAYAWINKPDLGAQYSDGKFKLTMVLDNVQHADTITDLKNKVKAAAIAEFGENIPANYHSPFKNGDDHKNEEFRGKTLIDAKTTTAPTAVDSGNNPLPDSIAIMSGDVVRVAGAFSAYAGANNGVTTYLNMVMLIEKNNTGSGDSASTFGTDNAGFVASGDTAPAPEAAPAPTAEAQATNNINDIDF